METIPNPIKILLASVALVSLVLTALSLWAEPMAAAPDTPVVTARAAEG